MTRPYPRRVYVSAGRRRARRRIGLILAAFAALVVVFFAHAGAGTDRRDPRSGAPAAVPRVGNSGPLGSEDGYVAVGASLDPFGDEPAVARLDAALREAVRQAASDAGAERITLRVNGGWRSARYQRSLLLRAVEEHGSVEAARQYVKPPEESSHVTGEAVDVGPTDAASWLSQNGSTYWLCQIYANEPWHYELRPEAVDQGCPPMYADPTQDPRMQHE